MTGLDLALLGLAFVLVVALEPLGAAAVLAMLVGLILARLLIAWVLGVLERRQHAHRVSDRARRISQDHARPLPVPGCHGCRLAEEAGPGYLAMHRRTEHRRAA